MILKVGCKFINGGGQCFLKLDPMYIPKVEGRF